MGLVPRHLSSVGSGVSAAAVGVLRRGARAWAGEPSGPLGWVSTRTVFPLTSGTLYETLADALQLRPDDELLDVACGSGAFLAQKASHVRKVAGVDLSAIQIDLARRNLRERIAAGTAEIVHGNAQTLPWPAESFTVVTCMASFEAFDDPAGVLAEMCRVLRPGGRLVVNFGQRVKPSTQTHQTALGLWVWAEADVPRLLAEAGFCEVTIAYGKAWGDDPLSTVLSKITGALGTELRIAGAVKK